MNIAIKSIKNNWLTIRVITAGVLMAIVTFVFCYVWFNYSVKIWTLDDYNKGITKVKFSGNSKNNTECVFALFIERRK
jgi:hypothetical protein